VIRCAKGCASLDAEWCTECGAKIASPPAPAPAPSAPGEPCPSCGTARRARFCERCGHDFVSPRASPPAAPVSPTAPGAQGLELVVTADASAGGEPLPADRVPVFRLEGRELLVGRRSVLKDIHPEVALDDDAGVSHRHAKLVREADGGWAVLDLGSQNGTELNGSLLVAGARTRIRAGDELRLGVRTLIRVREH